MAEIAYKTDFQTVPFPLSGDAATVFYAGSIVTNVKANKDLTQDGVLLMGAAVGAADTTAFKVPLGIVTGFNTFPRNEIFSGGAQYMTAIASSGLHAASADYLGGGSEHTDMADGPKALVALLDPSTYIKARIYNSTWGTAISVGSVTAAGVSTTGAGFTSSTVADYTPVAGLGTVYCRKGANRGAYRVTSDTSTTVKTVYDYFKYDIAEGDQFVSVPIRLGTCYLQLDATSRFIDASATPASNYYIVDVVELNLKEAGMEYAIFKFQPNQFDMARA
jgi:hypothetical protein